MAETATFRTSHRSVAVLFTVTVLANVVVAALGGPDWVGYVALAPLVVLMVTGWCLLWRTSPRRARRSAA